MNHLASARPNDKVIIIATGAITSSRLQRSLVQSPDFTLCGCARDLSEAYILTEREEPQLALVSQDLVRHPDFEGLISLFRVLGILWLKVDPIGSAARARPKEWVITADVSPAALRALVADQRQAYAAAQLSAPRPVRLEPAPTGFQPGRLLVIGASTGGIDALLTILSQFPKNCPPTAIVQHTGAAFSDSLIRLFARCCPAKVIAAAQGAAVTQGTVVIGAGLAGHFVLSGTRPISARVTAGPPVSGHVPSVDMLFRSALPYGADVVAALLTGMGRDGAEGLLALRKCGAVTLVQDEASSVVYGMPRAAVELGAAKETLPLPAIAPRLLQLCQQSGDMSAAR